MTGHLDDIKKHVSEVDETALANMEKTYRLVLRKPDSRAVSFSDEEELKTVRESFLKKKLGLTIPDAELDAAIKEVGKAIPGHKQRLTVYYLLAQKFDKLDVFH